MSVRIPVEVGFLYIVKFNLYCSRCIVKFKKCNLLLDSFSNVKVTEECIALHSVSVFSAYVLLSKTMNISSSCLKYPEICWFINSLLIWLRSRNCKCVSATITDIWGHPLQVLYSVYSTGYQIKSNFVLGLYEIYLLTYIVCKVSFLLSNTL